MNFWVSRKCWNVNKHSLGNSNSMFENLDYFRSTQPTCLVPLRITHYVLRIIHTDA